MWRSGGRWVEGAGEAKGCCLCNSTENSFWLPRNTICLSCFDGTQQVLDLGQQLEQERRDHMEMDRPRAPVMRQGLCNALKQMKHRVDSHEEASKKLDLLDSLVQAFREDVPADVELVTDDGQSLKAHRVVLAKNSSVFRTMFETDQMKEAHIGAVHIQELSHDFLEFLYCANIPDEKLAEHSHALLIAADKYDIPVLSNVCEAYIGRTVSLSNVWEILELATLCSAFSLKETATRFTLNKYDEFLFLGRYSIRQEGPYSHF